jgi:hypothetical protein
MHAYKFAVARGGAAAAAAAARAAHRSWRGGAAARRAQPRNKSQSTSSYPQNGARSTSSFDRLAKRISQGTPLISPEVPWENGHRMDGQPIKTRGWSAPRSGIKVSFLSWLPADWVAVAVAAAAAAAAAARPRTDTAAAWPWPPWPATWAAAPALLARCRARGQLAGWTPRGQSSELTAAGG